MICVVAYFEAAVEVSVGLAGAVDSAGFDSDELDFSSLCELLIRPWPEGERLSVE